MSTGLPRLAAPGQERRQLGPRGRRQFRQHQAAGLASVGTEDAGAARVGDDGHARGRGGNG